MELCRKDLAEKGARIGQDQVENSIHWLNRLMGNLKRIKAGFVHRDKCYGNSKRSNY